VSGYAFKSDSQPRQFSVLARQRSTVETPGSSTTRLHVGRGRRRRPSRRWSPLGRHPGAAESPSHHSRHQGSHVHPKEPTVGTHSLHGHRLRRARDRCVCPFLCASLRSVLCVFRGTCRFPSADAVRAVRQPLN
jgi:hypothetical protein